MSWLYGDADMKDYITIDGGTTNTRISLVKNEKIVKTIKLAIGARVGIDNKKLLVSEIKKAVEQLGNGEKLERILASGMITSEFGLYNLPHITVPAGIEELHGAMREITIPEISEIPFVFIPGIKVIGENLHETDMMRGEETELVGLCGGCCTEGLYILPGSHSKLIKVDSDGKIASFTTMLTGEMIAALSGCTILKDAVDLIQSETSEEFLLKGYDYCNSFGINETLFKTRVLKNLFGVSKKEVYSFFIGAVLNGEIKRIAVEDEIEIVIGGKAQIKNAMYKLLTQICNKKISLVSDEIAETAALCGMIRIYEHTNN